MVLVSASHQPCLRANCRACSRLASSALRGGDHVAVAVSVLVVVVVPQLAHRFDECAGGGLDIGYWGLGVILVKQAFEIPGQGGVDGVIAAVGGEEAHFGGAVQEGHARFAGQAAHFGQAPVGLGVAHPTQRIHIHKALEKVQQGQLLALLFVESVLKAVAQRGSQ